MTSINSQILIWAREVSGTTIEQSYEKFSKQKIDDWESGNDYPTYSQLKQLCEFYRKPVAVCFMPEPPKMKSVRPSFRTFPYEYDSIFNRNLQKHIDEARAHQIYLYELNENKNENLKIFYDDESPLNTVAAKFRMLLDAPLEEQKRIKSNSDAFEYWRDKFYYLGIYVFKSAFQDLSISGFCLYDELFPVIYINNSFSFTRQIFTLFHEAFHLFNKTSGIDIFDDTNLLRLSSIESKKIEINCNKFAGAFLVPDAEFDNLVLTNKPTDPNIEKLSNLYCVSREVILRKFYDRKLISKSYYQEKSSDLIKHKRPTKDFL